MAILKVLVVELVILLAMLGALHLWGSDWVIRLQIFAAAGMAVLIHFAIRAERRGRSGRLRRRRRRRP